MASAPDSSIVERDIQRAIDRLVSGQRGAIMSVEQRAAIIALLHEGATLTGICRREGMPHIADVYVTCAHDPQFAADLDAARRLQATTRLDRAQDVLDDALATNDIDAIRGAAVYAEQTTRYAEKIAPREYGQLVKIADVQQPVSVQVLSYASGKSIAQSERTHARDESRGEGETQSLLEASDHHEGGE